MRTSVDKPALTVINGGGRKPSAWIDLPPVIVCASPSNRSEIKAYRLSGLNARKALEHGNRQPLLDIWSLMLGRIPPVNNALTKWGTEDVLSGLKPLSGAHACFRGIKRPMGDDDQGFDVLAYITKPRVMFKYEPNLSCSIKPVCIADDLVCVTYVRIDYPDIVRRPQSLGVSKGVITHCEIVEADGTGYLPIDSEERYRRKMW